VAFGCAISGAISPPAESGDLARRSCLQANYPGRSVICTPISAYTSSVTRYAAALCRLPWTGSAHSKDIWSDAGLELREKLGFVRMAGHVHRDESRALAKLAPPDRVELVYHGLDLDRFPPVPVGRPRAIGATTDDSVIICRSRLVEKKGTDILLDSLAGLPANLHWRLVHVAAAPWRSLRRRGRRAGHLHSGRLAAGQ